MSGHTNPPHVVVAGTRRAWSTEEKRAILAEVREGTASVSVVARRHGVHASLLFRWRRQERAAEAAPEAAPLPTFVPLSLSAPAGPPAAGPARPAGSIEIEMASGHRVRAEPGADLAMLRGVIEALIGR